MSRLCGKKIDVLERRLVPEPVRAIPLAEAEKMGLAGKNWSGHDNSFWLEPELLNAELKVVIQRLSILEEYLSKIFVKVEMVLHTQRDMDDWASGELKIMGYRWETDAEYQKRNDSLLKRRENAKKHQIAVQEKKNKEQEQKKKREYTTYLKLKKKYEGASDA